MNDQPNPIDPVVVAEQLNRIIHLAQRMTATNSVNRQVLFELGKSPINNLLQAGSHTPNWKPLISGIAAELLSLRNMDQGTILKDCSDDGGDCPSCGTFLKKKTGKAEPRQSQGKNAGAKSNWYFYCPECSKPLETAVEKVKASLT